MRFKTEQEGLEHIKDKDIPDPRSWNQHFKQCLQKIPVVSAENSRIMFEQWLWLKRFMFSPEELIALVGIDHRGRKGQINQALRNHHINTFVDWAEERPRRRAVIVIDASQKNSATAIAKQIDILGGDNTFFGLGLSVDGKEPASHLWCSWNCSASEYDFFEKQNQTWWQLFEVKEQDLLPDETMKEYIDRTVLTPRGLKRIEPELPESVELGGKE